MLPEFVPYIVNRKSHVDLSTGKTLGWRFDKIYRLFHIPTGEIKNFSNIVRMYYVDEFLRTSTTLVLECQDKERNTKYTIVNNINDIKSPLWFDYLEVVTPQIIVVRKSNKWGIINDKLQMKCFFEYDSLEEYISLNDQRIFIIAEKDGKYGLLNEDLSIKFPFDFDTITCNCSLGVFVLQSEDATTVFDVEVNNITKFPFIIRSIKDINEGCIVVEKNKMYNVYDSDAQRFISDEWFGDIDTFQNGFSLCDGRYILYRDGSIVDLGKGLRCNRTDDVVYSTKHLQDDEWEITVFRRHAFVSRFTHIKDRYGFFYCRVMGEQYLEIGSYSDKYSLHTPEALYNMEGKSVSMSLKHDFPPKEKKTEKMSSVSELNRYKSHGGKSYKIDNIDDFENKFFPNSKHLSTSDEFEVIELEQNLLRLETMDVDDGRCYWHLLGYIYNGIKLWVDIKISND